MIGYKKKYLKHFGYGEQDFIPCEICKAEAVDVHHIDGDRRNNKIINLMGLCRDCHNKAHSSKIFYQKAYFQKVHNGFLQAA